MYTSTKMLMYIFEIDKNLSVNKIHSPCIGNRLESLTSEPVLNVILF